MQGLFRNITGLVALVLLVTSCGKITPYRNDDTNSTFSEDESHEFGENCMNCHYSAGKGEGWFTLAGSVSGNTDNAVIELYNNFGESPVKTIEVDTKGNFYTTDAIDFTNGYNVAIKNSAGEMTYMGGRIEVGQCNLCHGATTGSLSIN